MGNLSENRISKESLKKKFKTQLKVIKKKKIQFYKRGGFRN